MMVLLRPLDTIHNKKENKKEEIQVRSYSDENFRSMGKLLENFDTSPTALKGLRKVDLNS